MDTIEKIKTRCSVDDSGCWNWIGATASGYGRFKRNGVLFSAHREAYLLANPEVDLAGLEVCHTCDNRRCCNPEHLFAGTHSENMLDCSRKGRLSCQNGKHKKAIYGPEFIPIVKSMQLSGLSKRAIAKALGWPWGSFQHFAKRHAIFADRVLAR